MSVHVFVVDKTTFKIHLEYMFAGTGATDKCSPFLSNAAVDFHHSTERNLVGMIADISRVRPGDKIIFYLQATSTNPGMFYGIFRAETIGFFDENDNDNYLVNELGKGLSFRVKIAPDSVYPIGITERDYLDDLSGKKAPYQLCWSLIYRKLKGNRGCTMITQYEYEDLLLKLDNKNKGQKLDNTYFSYDEVKSSIINTTEVHQYLGRMETLNIEPRLLHKATQRKAFETHLQAYIMQHFDDPNIRELILAPGSEKAWIGNEVSCGVGMQRIDVLIIQEISEEIYIKIVELKDEEPYDYIVDEQLPWYLKWVSQYMVPNLMQCGKNLVIHPCIIAKKTSETRMINKIRNSKLTIENFANSKIMNTEYIGFSVNESSIDFEKII